MAKISKSKAQVLFYHVLLKTNRNLNSIFQTQKSSKQNGSSNSVFRCDRKREYKNESLISIIPMLWGMKAVGTKMHALFCWFHVSTVHYIL